MPMHCAKLFWHPLPLQLRLKGNQRRSSPTQETSGATAALAGIASATTAQQAGGQQQPGQRSGGLGDGGPFEGVVSGVETETAAAACGRLSRVKRGEDGSKYTGDFFSQPSHRTA
jgi:hypothetical protein